MQHPVPVSSSAAMRNVQAGLVSTALIIAALYVGREIIVPIVLAVLLAFVLAPLVVLLRRLMLPNGLAVVLAVLIGVGGCVGLGAIMVRQVAGLAVNLASYRAQLATKLEGLHLREWLADAQGALESMRGMTGAATGAEAGTRAAVAVPAEAAATPIQLLQEFAAPVLGPLATGGIVILFAIFVRLYRQDLRDRVIRLAGARDLHRTTVALNDAARRLSRLYLAQVGLNAGLGLFVGVALWLLGLPGAALWGIFAGLMRFVPFVGTPIAVLPPLFLAAAVEPGWGMFFAVLALFAVIEPLMGQVIEPMVFGHSTGLSPVAVIIATVFWSFIWGPVGLLMAVPVTVCLVVLGSHVPSLSFLNVMLGDSPSLKPEESLYQRLLQRDAAATQDHARQALRQEPGVVPYLDNVALPALALADQDWTREVLEPERLESLRNQVSELLGVLAEDVPPAEPNPADALCLVVPGRGRLDDLSASIAVLALQLEGRGTGVLAAGDAQEAEAIGRARLCCISVLESGSSPASVRLLIRRWEKALPGVTVLVGLWHAEAESEMLTQLRRENAGHIIVTSLSELIAYWRATVEQPPEARLPPVLGVA